MRWTLCHLFIPAALLVTGFVATAKPDKPMIANTAGRRFIGICDFRAWTVERSAATAETVYTSPEINGRIDWNELIVSWNVLSSPTRRMKIEAQALYPDHVTKWYVMGLWSDDPARHPHESVKLQKDDDGDVDTDTLVLTRPASRLRLRITIGGEGERDSDPPAFVGLSLLDTRAQHESTDGPKTGRAVCLDVPQRSQLSYEGGKVWCCPTSTSMVLAYWAQKLKKPELDRDVPLVAAGVFDPNWPGTGNWPFNTAYAGSLPGMRAYVTRLAGIGELTQWIRDGIPVVCSVSYRLLHGKENAETGGHVVVCCGFTAQGDVIVHDPWAELDRGETVRITVPRKRMIAAWAKSHNTVFLIYSTGWKTPQSRAGHW